MKRGENKGISPLIATVSLIVISMVLFGIIYIWSRSFVSEQILKFDKPIEQFCEQVNLEVNVEESDGGLKFTLNNIGNVNVYKIDVKYIYAGGSNVTSYYAGDNDALPSGKLRSFSVKDIDINSIKSIEITPKILGKGQESNKPYEVPCENAKKEISLK